MHSAYRIVLPAWPQVPSGDQQNSPSFIFNRANTMNLSTPRLRLVGFRPTSQSWMVPKKWICSMTEWCGDGLDPIVLIRSTLLFTSIHSTSHRWCNFKVTWKSFLADKEQNHKLDSSLAATELYQHLAFSESFCGVLINGQVSLRKLNRMSSNFETLCCLGFYLPLKRREKK